VNRNIIDHIRLAESILLDKFQQEPFHNLYRVHGIEPKDQRLGGTCSDKTLSYLTSIEAAGLKGFLHAARIGDQMNHRLVRLEIQGQNFFADIGNGWPSLRLYPSHHCIDYSCFGMRFRSEIFDDVIKIYHTRNGKESLQMEFDKNPQCQISINDQILNRFKTGTSYPFDKGLRFSMIVDQQFLFIRDSSLEIYREGGFERIEGICPNDLNDVVKRYFNFDLNAIINGASCNLK
jgi:arylamine N-acetyltransferase